MQHTHQEHQAMTAAQRKAADTAARVAARDAKRAQKQQEREKKEAAEKAQRQAAKDAKRAEKAKEREAADAKARAQKEADRHAARSKKEAEREAERQSRQDAKAAKKQAAEAAEEAEKEARKQERENNMLQRRAMFAQRHETTKVEGVRRPKASFIIYTGNGFSKPQSVSTRGRILKWIADNVAVGGAIDIASIAKACKPFLYGASVRGFLSKLEETGHIDFWYGDESEDTSENESEAQSLQE